MKKKKVAVKVFLSFFVFFVSLFIAVLFLFILLDLYCANKIGVLSDLKYFIFGVFLYPFFHFFAFRRYPKIYVISHELSHAFFVWLFHGWVRRIKIGKSAGYVETTKDNVFISLAPYFFPFYTFVFFIVYLLSLMFVKNMLIISAVKTIIGISYGFHIVYTVNVVLTSQEDFEILGRFGSYGFVVMANLAVFLLICGFLSKHIELENFLFFLGKRMNLVYKTIKNFV